MIYTKIGVETMLYTKIGVGTMIYTTIGVNHCPILILFFLNPYNFC